MSAQPSGLDPQMKNPGTNTRDGATILALVAAVLWGLGLLQYALWHVVK
jgi:hypothetical protein